MSSSGLTTTGRFWSKVQLRNDGECFRWRGFKDKKGYGRLGFKRNEKWTMGLAHRFSWELAYGPVPNRFCVLHRCDNPECVRPDHLFLGTKADNNLDAEIKGRRVPPPHYRGDAWRRTHPIVPCLYAKRVRLSEEKVREIRKLAARGTTTADIARRYGIADRTAFAVVHYETWKHIA